MVEPLSRGRDPFDTSGIRRDGVGVAHYARLAPSLVHALADSVQRHGDTPALVELDGRTLSYRELWEAAARVAGGLRAEGVAPGDRVAVRLPNGLDWVSAFVGTLLAGAVAVPVNMRLTEPEVDYVLTDSGARYVFSPGEPLPDGPPVEPAQPGPADLAAIFYTSGTTGFPKGAMTTHENFLSNVETFYRVGRISPGERAELRTLVSVPLFHVTGCNSQLLPVLLAGGTVVIMRAPDPGRFLAAIGEQRITSLVTVPALYFHVLRQPAAAQTDLSGVRWLAYGGAPIAPSLVARIREAFPRASIGNGFGLTEVASIATFLPDEDAAAHAESVGYAAPVVDLALAEADPATGVGELLIRGPNVVAGYWAKPEATSATFADGWLHSGDLARVDDDGLTYVVDRAKDMINRGGENVYSVEVENALAAAPGVFEAAVVAVPDEMMGEKVGAVLMPAPGGSLDVEAVLAHLADHLADFKIPQFVEVRTEPLPRNPGGKVLKPVLRASFAGKRYR